MTIDLTSIIVIIIAIIVIYLIIRFIVSPFLKIIFVILAFLIFIYILKNFFNFDLSQVLAPFGITVDLNKFGSAFKWILTPIDQGINEIKNLWNAFWQNIPKS